MEVGEGCMEERRGSYILEQGGRSLHTQGRKNSSTLGQFRPIALLNVEGKIMFGFLSERLDSFLLETGLVNTSVQRASVPGSPGCLEHSSMIWHTIQEAKRQKKDLSVVWLDLANAYD